MYLSKSIYVRVWNCPKNAWINKYHPEAVPQDANRLARFRTGDEVGDLARRNLLAYCRLDTLAMVKVWEELKKTPGYASHTLREA